jgi:hypothetical protein
MLSVSTPPEASKAYPVFVTPVTVSVYAPRGPDVWNRARPVDPVVAVAVRVVPSGRLRGLRRSHSAPMRRHR